MHKYLYIYIYIEREREREIAVETFELPSNRGLTPSLIITAPMRRSLNVCHTSAWHDTHQDNPILYYTILYYTVLYYTILYYTIYYTILYYTILYYTILYYTIPFYAKCQASARQSIHAIVAIFYPFSQFC